MIALVCIDVDGTLVGSSGTVSAAVWEAAARLRARGVRLAICSGRPGFGLARGFAERLDADGWHVFQNGASVVRLPGGETRSEPLPAAGVAALVARARALNRTLELYGDADYAVESYGERARQHAALLGVPFAPHDLAWFAEGAGVVRAQWLLPHDEAEAVMAEPHDGLTVAHSLSPVMPGTSFVNITPAGVDKAAAVRRVADAYGVPLARVMMVGDGQNDVSVMRAVGLAVAMGNAEPAARAAARVTVGDVDHDGLVEAFALLEGL